MSSAIARASRKTRAGAGTRSPRRIRTPTEKAMSVAIGTPQPCAPGPPRLQSEYSRAGTTIPPSAATTGKAACRTLESRPSSSSRLISSPTT